MNTPRQFLHKHSAMQLAIGLDYEHVIVDREDWQEFIKVPSLPVRFHKWMLENDTEANAERFANYEDEDMYREFLRTQILIQK